MGENLKRFAIIFIIALFLITTVGVSVVGFWQGTHPSKDDAAEQTPPTDTASSCAPGTPVDAKALPKPEVFKPTGKVTKLEITDLEQGTGNPVKPGDCLIMKYYGTLATSGKMFDENYTKEGGFQFELGKGQVIKGWDEGLVGMKAGGTRRLVIPSALAYGAQAQGETIPANSDLVFTVYLDSVK